MATVHRKETMIALRARSKAFRVALDFLHPQHLELPLNVPRCSCGGELRIVEPDKGAWTCMICGKEVVSVVANEKPESAWDEPGPVHVSGNSPLLRALAWVLLTLLVLGTIAIGVMTVLAMKQANRNVQPPAAAPAGVLH